MQELTHLFDPLCGWCYGAEPGLRQILRLPGISLRLLPTGTFASAPGRRLDRHMATQIWSIDQRIHALSGQVFSEAYRLQVLGDPDARLASAGATLALTAVAETAPEVELDALAAIQSARYAGGRDITSDAVLAECLNGLGLTAAAALFTDRPASLTQRNSARIAEGAAKLARYGFNGVPSLVLERDGEARPIDSGILYGKPEHLREALAIRDTANPN